MNSGMAERIINSAAELFSRSGYSHVRVDDIADYAGISKKTIYNYFPNKSALIEAVIESNTLTTFTKIDEFIIENRVGLNWLKRIYLLIVFCCQELSEWVFGASEYGQKNLRDAIERSMAQIRRKILDKAEQFFDADCGKATVRRDISSRAMFSLSAAVVEGVFTINGLSHADEIEQNPLIRNLETMVDAYETENAGLPVYAEAEDVDINKAPGSWEADNPDKGDGPGHPNLGAGHKIKKIVRIPTYEELQHLVEEMKKESSENKQVEDDLRRSKDRLSLALEISEAMPWEINLKTCQWHCDPGDYETYGHETRQDFEETIQLVESTLRYLKNTDDMQGATEAIEISTHPDDRDRLFLAGKAVLDGEKSAYEGDFRMLDKDGKWAWYYGKAKVTGWDGEGTPEILSGLAIDITERKKVEETLREREARLASQTHKLEETNTALKVLLKNRDEDKKEFEAKIISNLKEMVFPFIEKLKSSRLNESQMVYLEIIVSHLNDMTAPFLHRLSSRYSGLTPAEIKVAVFVKEGKTTKEIAELLNTSPDAVSFHRNNLRKKFGLVNSKTNLRTYLLSLS